MMEGFDILHLPSTLVLMPCLNSYSDQRYLTYLSSISPSNVRGDAAARWGLADEDAIGELAFWRWIPGKTACLAGRGCEYIARNTFCCQP